MEEIPTWLPVVAAVLKDGEGRMLLQQRPAGKHHALRWEFPGGKVEAHETPRACLAREICEELALRPDPAAMRPLGFAEEPSAGGGGGIVLLLYDCPVWEGAVHALEGQAFGWFSAAEASRLDLAPMDRRLLEILSR